MKIYLILINALGFVLMLADKIFAKAKTRRIPEAVLLGIAAAGGSFGAALGMWTVRHKTRHTKFSVSLPLLMALHAFILYASYSTFAK